MLGKGVERHVRPACVSPQRQSSEMLSRRQQKWAAELKLRFQGDGDSAVPQGCPSDVGAGRAPPAQDVLVAGVARGLGTCRVQDGDCGCWQGMWQPPREG